MGVGANLVHPKRPPYVSFSLGESIVKIIAVETADCWPEQAQIFFSDSKECHECQAHNTPTHIG